jgi:hypothetical protein
VAEKRGNPKKPFIGPKLPDAGRGDLPNPNAPECGHVWRDSHGKWQRCRKRGRHYKHGKG